MDECGAGLIIGHMNRNDRRPLATMIAVALFIVSITGGASASPPDSVQYVPRVDRLTYVAFVPAKQRCENWAFAAALQSVLEMQGVGIPQATWVAKLSGNGGCGMSVKSAADLPDIIDGDYKLDSGATIRLKTEIVDTSVDPGRLIGDIRANRPFLVTWKNHVYMASAIYYVDEVHASGLHKYDIQEIHLMDPFSGAEQQPVVFHKSRTTLNEINSIVEVTASR
jgi:hypothetical protein